jgi:hypothetical protein
MQNVSKLAPLALCVLLPIASCDNSPGDAGGESNSSDMRTSELAAANNTSTSAPTPINWSAVPVLSGHEDMGELMRLTRHVNAWHGTTRKTINLRFKAPSEAVDDFGNSIPMTPTQWKSIIELIEGTKIKPVQMVTPPARFSGDSFGELPQLIYEVHADGNEHLRYVFLREHKR